ncbi:hypothetical protein D3C77_605290 [compost metagenome]
MNISLSPVLMAKTLTLVKAGDTLTINGESFDFSALPDGATLPFGSVASEWVFGDVNRTAGELEITITLPLPDNYSQEQAFPVPLINVSDGVVTLPQPLAMTVVVGIDEQPPQASTETNQAGGLDA